MKVTNEQACQFEGCTSYGLPRYGLQSLGEPDERHRVCDEHWIAYRAETIEVPSEPIPPFGCAPAEYREWQDRVQWRPGNEAEVAAEHARLMDENNRGWSIH